MEGWKEHINKIITVFYDDGQAVSKKIGKLVKLDEKFLFLNISNSEQIAIPISRVVRVEVDVSFERGEV